MDFDLPTFEIPAIFYGEDSRGKFGGGGGGPASRSNPAGGGQESNPPSVAEEKPTIGDLRCDVSLLIKKLREQEALTNEFRLLAKKRQDELEAMESERAEELLLEERKRQVREEEAAPQGDAQRDALGGLPEATDDAQEDVQGGEGDEGDASAGDGHSDEGTCDQLPKGQLQAEHLQGDQFQGRSLVEEYEKLHAAASAAAALAIMKDGQGKLGADEMEGSEEGEGCEGCEECDDGHNDGRVAKRGGKRNDGGKRRRDNADDAYPKPPNPNVYLFVGPDSLLPYEAISVHRFDPRGNFLHPHIVAKMNNGHRSPKKILNNLIVEERKKLLKYELLEGSSPNCALWKQVILALIAYRDRVNVVRKEFRELQKKVARGECVYDPEREKFDRCDG